MRSKYRRLGRRPSARQMSDAVTGVSPTLTRAELVALGINDGPDTRTVTVEVWRDQEALDSHMQSPHLQEAFAAAGDHLGGDVAIHPLVPVV